MNRLLLAMFALVVFMTGCASVSTGGFEVSFSETDNGAYKLRTDDKRLARDITIERTIVHRETSEYLSAHIMVRNMNKADFPVQYRFMFFDANGVEIRPGDRGWEQKVLHGGEAVSLSAVAPTKSVSSFAVRIRRVN